MPRLLVIGHGHPVLSPGGAEAAAYAVHSIARRGLLTGWESVFLGRVNRSNLGHDGELGSFRGAADEIIASPPGVDYFFMRSLAPAKLYALLDVVLEAARPDVVHAHHFVYWGLDIFSYFNSRRVPLVFTFHEYISICQRNGQMLKTNGRLCYSASPAECNHCFPDISSGMFFLRRRMFLESLHQAHTLISPSQFLAGRLSTWSRGALDIKVLENPRDRSAYEPIVAPEALGHNVPHVGFFGQINPFKGVHILLRAFAILKQRNCLVRLRLFGANLDIQEPDFKASIEAQLTELGDIVEFFGPYRNESVIRLMQTCAAVAIPSIWWENSPVVIQEARDAGVRIVASRLGGIEEKLADYDQAFMADPGSPHALADAIERALKSGDPRQPAPGAPHDLTKTDELDKLREVYDQALQAADKRQ